MELKTPNGFTVVLKEESDLTFADKRAIKKAMLTGMVLEEGKKAQLNGTAIMDAEDEILRIILLRIVTPEGVTMTDNLYDKVMGLKSEDGDVIYEYVDSILNGKQKN